MKKAISLLLCFALILAMSISAFAEYDQDPSQTRATTYYISGDGVALRPTPGVSNDPIDGYLYKNDKVEKRYVSVGNTYTYLFYASDGHGNIIPWWSVSVKSGDNNGDNGYVAAMYISSTMVN